MVTPACLFFLAVVGAIVVASVLTKTSMFTDLRDPSVDEGVALGNLDTFAPHTEPDPHSGFHAIRDADPAFTIEGFRARVEEMFLAYHKAAESGDLSATRSFIDPRYYPHLADTTRIAHDAGMVRAVTGVRDIRPAIARHENGMDMVRSTVVGTTASGGVVVEYWELLRQRGAVTKPQMTIYRCPNCGGPIDGDDPTRCAYCGTRLADPAVDWVVRQIDTQ